MNHTVKLELSETCKPLSAIKIEPSDDFSEKLGKLFKINLSI